MLATLKTFLVTYNTDRFGPVDIHINAVDAMEAAQVVMQEPYFLGIMAIREEEKAFVDFNQKPR